MYMIDAATGRTDKVITIKSYPDSFSGTYTMAMAQDGKSLFVSTHTEIVRIDTINKQIASVISTGKKHSAAESITMTLDGSKILSVDNSVISWDKNDDNQPYIYIIDTQTNTLTHSIPKNNSPGLSPHGFTSIAIDHKGKKAYLLDEVNLKIAMLDLDTNQLTLKAIPNYNNIFLTDVKGRMAINSSDSLLYVSERPGNAASVAVIDLNTYDRIDRIKFEGIFARDIVIMPDNSKIYVFSRSQYNSGSVVTVINARTNQVIKEIQLKGSSDGFLHITQDGKKVYAAPAGINLIHVINTETDEVIKTYNIKRMS